MSRSLQAFSPSGCGPVGVGIASAWLALACLPGVAPAAEADVASLTVIEDAAHAGRIVAEADGGPLNFESLATISPEVAAVLGTHPADILLNALRKLDADVAAEWADFEHTLSLHGITELDDETAAVLATSKATLSLENLESLSHLGLAEKLAAQPYRLIFRRITAVPDPVADVFATGSCGLALPALERLEHAALARKLTNGGQIPCVFEKMNFLTVAAAAALCSERCDLYFKSLREIPPRVAAVFEGHQGVLDLDRLRRVHPEAAASLLKNNGPLDLGGCDGFVVAGQPVPAAVLEALATHAGPLTLGDLKDVPTDLADVIRRRTHHTALPDVECLTIELAETLAGKGGVQGVVWFPNTEAAHPGAVPALLTMNPSRVLPSQLGPPAVILSPGLRPRIPEGHVRGIERHLAVHFGNQFGP